MSEAGLGLQQSVDRGHAVGRGDPVRKAVTILLLIYLSPALLVVFVVGGLGVALCWAVRWVNRLVRRSGPAPQGGVSLPHLLVAGRELPAARR